MGKINLIMYGSIGASTPYKIIFFCHGIYHMSEVTIPQEFIKGFIKHLAEKIEGDYYERLEAIMIEREPSRDVSKIHEEIQNRFAKNFYNLVSLCKLLD